MMIHHLVLNKSEITCLQSSQVFAGFPLELAHQTHEPAPRQGRPRDRSHGQSRRDAKRGYR